MERCALFAPVCFEWSAAHCLPLFALNVTVYIAPVCFECDSTRLSDFCVDAWSGSRRCLAHCLPLFALNAPRNTHSQLRFMLSFTTRDFIHNPSQSTTPGTEHALSDFCVDAWSGSRRLTATFYTQGTEHAISFTTRDSLQHQARNTQTLFICCTHIVLQHFLLSSHCAASLSDFFVNA